MSNQQISDMNTFFSAEYARKKLIENLKKKGNSDEDIKKFIEMCDQDYRDNGTPYPYIPD